MLRLMARLTKDERGATAVEYALIISFIVLSMIVGFSNVAGTTTNMWNNVANSVGDEL